VKECKHDWRTHISVAGTRVRTEIRCALCKARGVEQSIQK
jgi:hypothetical protein